MLVVKRIRHRNKDMIPTIISSLIATEQQDCASVRVKSKEHPIRFTRMLYPKLFHVRMTRRVNKIGMRTRKTGANLLKQDHFGVHVHLFGFAQTISPVRKLVRKFDLPFHRVNIAQRLCFVKVNQRCDG
jgi:hypothetical protein